jgi:hypothetical protein
MVASVTLIQMSSEDSGSTLHDITHHLELLCRNRMCAAVLFTMFPEDIGDLENGAFS